MLDQGKKHPNMPPKKKLAPLTGQKSMKMFIKDANNNDLKAENTANALNITTETISVPQQMDTCEPVNESTKSTKVPNQSETKKTSHVRYKIPGSNFGPGCLKMMAFCIVNLV